MPRKAAVSEGVIPKRGPYRKVGRKNTQASTVHASRETEQSAMQEIRPDLDAPWERPTSLAAPKPRAGMVQRWIRVAMGGTDDHTNYSRKSREGWRPRPADTVPDSFHVPRMDHGKFSGSIVVEGMVLMEMPAARNAQRTKYFSDRTKIVTQAIDDDLIQANQVTGGGFGPIGRSQRSGVLSKDEVLREVRVQGNDAQADED